MGDDNDPWNSLSSDIVDGLDSTENIKSEHAEVIEKLQDIAKISAAFKAQQQPIDTEIPRQQGTVLFSWGHLQVKEKIGEGSYGEVYRAYDSTLDRDVALKLLKQDKLAPYQSRAFIQEARRMAKVRNRHVLAVHGANVHHSKVGMWSDLIDGNDLTSAEKLSTEELFYLLESLCSALSAVHEAGLVHGDIKPSNVMQDTKGKITLMDFGAGIESEQELDSSGYLKGTPLYMAPEMFKGQAINQMTDIYALGTMMFLLISQRYPIKASNLAAIKHAHKKHAYHALKASQHPHPKPLIQVVNQMVQHDPSQRPTTEHIQLVYFGHQLHQHRILSRLSGTIINCRRKTKNRCSE